MGCEVLEGKLLNDEVLLHKSDCTVEAIEGGIL